MHITIQRVLKVPHESQCYYHPGYWIQSQLHTWILCILNSLGSIPTIFHLTGSTMLIHTTNGVHIIHILPGGEQQWLCSHGLESRSGTWFKTWFELRAFTWATNAFAITIRICALRVIFCSYYAVRARWLTHALMYGFSAHFWNAHARITFRKSFAFTWSRIRLSRRITIQNALFSAFQNAFQKPDLKQLCVHMG